MNRRSFLRSAVVAAPWVITSSGLLMPIKKVWSQQSSFQVIDTGFFNLSMGGKLLGAIAYRMGSSEALYLVDTECKPISGRVDVSCPEMGFRASVEVVDGIVKLNFK